MHLPAALFLAALAPAAVSSLGTLSFLPDFLSTEIRSLAAAGKQDVLKYLEQNQKILPPLVKIESKPAKLPSDAVLKAAFCTKFHELRVKPSFGLFNFLYKRQKWSIIDDRRTTAVAYDGKRFADLFFYRYGDMQIDSKTDYVWLHVDRAKLLWTLKDLPHVRKVYEIDVTSRTIIFAFEAMNGCSFQDSFVEAGALSEVQVKAYLKDLTLGLKEIFGAGYVLYPKRTEISLYPDATGKQTAKYYSPCILKKEENAKRNGCGPVDSLFFSDEPDTTVPAPEWKPEADATNLDSAKMAVFALGEIFHEIVTGVKLIVVDGQPKFSAERTVQVSPSVVDTIKGMVNPDPATRLSIDQVLQKLEQ